MELQRTTVKTVPTPFKMLTKQELHDTAIERIHLISEEFTKGFNFLGNYPKSVTIFGGLRLGEDSPYYSLAQSLAGRVVKDLGYSILTGGSVGIMEAANRGAFEAHGDSIGLTIDLPHKQVQNHYLTKNIDFYYFFSRKVCLAFSAEAYVFFPGGFGTLDEFFEIITLVQTGKIEKVPVVLMGADYWRAFDDLFKKELLSRGTISPEDLNIYTITDDIDKAIEIIKEAPIRNGIKFVHNHLEEPLLETQKVSE
jgi:uncharacterized protein (TIGR00730 family)